MLSIDRAGFVIYETEKKESHFWQAVKPLFVPLDGAQKRWRLTVFPLGEPYTYYEDASEDFNKISQVIKAANRHFEEIPQELADRMDEAEEAYLIGYMRRKLARRSKSLRTHYIVAKSRGCIGCKYLVDGVDTFYCKAMKHYLDFKNIPTDHNGVRYLINFVPFPMEGCVYNISKKEEEEMNERALQKLSELIHAAHAASGSEREELYKQIGKLLVSEAEWEPLVIHNTDTWSDEKVEVRDE